MYWSLGVAIFAKENFNGDSSSSFNVVSNFNGDSSSNGFEEDIYNKDGNTLYEIDILPVYLVQIQVYIFEKRYS